MAIRSELQHVCTCGREVPPRARFLHRWSHVRRGERHSFIGTVEATDFDDEDWRRIVDYFAARAA